MTSSHLLTLAASPWGRYLQRFARSVGNSGLAWAKAVGPAADSSPPASRVLVATSVGGHLTALNFEAVVAASLLRRDTQVHALLCDAALPACMEAEHRYYPTPSRRRSLVKHGPRELCISCTRVGRGVYDDLGVPVILYRDFLTAEDADRVEQILAATDDASIRSFRLDELPVGLANPLQKAAPCGRVPRGCITFRVPFRVQGIEGNPVQDQLQIWLFRGNLAGAFHPG